MAEAEAVSAVFIPDEVTYQWFDDHGIGLTGQPPLVSRNDNLYDVVTNMDLEGFTPVAALPFSPSNVRAIDDPEIENIPIDKVIIGSCTNGMYQDLLRAALVIHRSARASSGVEFLVYPGSRDIFARCKQPDYLLDGQSVADVLEGAGAVFRKSWCGPCFGMGSDKLGPGQTAVATFNRNWKNRSGIGGQVILTSPETAAASVIEGCLAFPSEGDL